MKMRTTLFIGMIVGLFVLSIPVVAQVKYQVSPKADLKVTGTSTLHAWEMNSTEANGEGILVLQDGQLKEVRILSVQMPAESLKSGKRGMDRITYETLNTKKHQQIQFVLSEISPAGAGKWEAKGNFTIAGATRPATFEVKSSTTGAGFNFQGKHAFKLTDYKMDPPTAILGTVKTGDEVVIHFDITLQPTK